MKLETDLKQPFLIAEVTSSDPGREIRVTKTILLPTLQSYLKR